MKKLLIVAMIITGFWATAQQVEADSQNYFVLTRKVEQLKPILHAASELKNTDGSKFGDFQVVICGKAVTALEDSDLIKGFLIDAREIGVALKVCGFSLEKFQVKTSELPEAIETVENGILHGFHLQKKGYYSITL